MTINMGHQFKIALCLLRLAVLTASSTSIAAVEAQLVAPDSTTVGVASLEQTKKSAVKMPAHTLPTMSLTTPQNGDYVIAKVGQPPILDVRGLCSTPNTTEIHLTFTSFVMPAMTLAPATVFCNDGAFAASIDLTSYPYGELNIAASMTDQFGQSAAALSLMVVKAPRISTSITPPYNTLTQTIQWPTAVDGQAASYQLDLQGSDDCSAAPIQSFNFTTSSNLVTFPGTGLYYLCLSFKPSPEATTVTTAPLAMEISPLGAPGSHPWGTGAGSNPMVPDLTSTSWISPTKDSGCSRLIVFNSKTVYMEYQSCPLNFNIIGVEVIKGTYLQSGSDLELSPPTSTSCPGRYWQAAGAATLFVHADSDGNLYLFKDGELYESYFPLNPYPRGSDNVKAADIIAAQSVTSATQGPIIGCLGGGDPQNPGDTFTSMKPTAH